jgi:hypothetical protein
MALSWICLVIVNLLVYTSNLIFEVWPDFELVRFNGLELDLSCDCEFVGLDFKSGLLRLGQILNL